MLSCPNCCQPYEGTKGTRIPVLLSCGCTFCTHCLRALAAQCGSVRCPGCTGLTEVERTISLEQQLIPNFYLLGQVVAAELGLPKNHKVSESWLWSQSLKSTPLQRSLCGPVPRCEECKTEAAVVRCMQCTANYCQPCSQQVHASSHCLRRHTPIPITQALGRPDTCPAHPAETMRYYCVQDDTLICSECALNGEHTGHKTSTTTNAANEWRLKLEPLVAKAEKTLKETAKSSKLLSRQLSLMQTATQQQVEHLSLLMPTLHKALQMRESALCVQLSEMFGQYAVPCIHAHECLEKHKLRVQEVIKTTKEVLRDDFKLIGLAGSLLEQLSTVDTFPSGVDIGSSGNMRFSIDREYVVDWINTLGQVQMESVQQSPELFSHCGSIFDYLSEAADILPAGLHLHPPKLRCKSTSPGHKMPARKRRVIRSSSPHVKASMTHSNASSPPGNGSRPSGNASRPPSNASRPPSNTSRPPSNTPRTTPTKRGMMKPLSPAHVKDGVTPQKATPLSNGHGCRAVSPQDLVEVGVTHVENPEQLYVQEMSKMAELQDLQSQVNQHCTGSYTPPSPEELREGVQCGARFSSDGVWYRAVLDMVSPDKAYVTVHYIDYGNTESLSPLHLCSLPACLRIIPPLAIRCSFYNIKPPVPKTLSLAPPTWKRAATYFLKETLVGPVKMQVVQQTPLCLSYVDLFVGAELESVREKLLMRGVALSDNSCTPAMPSLRMLPEDDELSVYITFAETPWDFCVHDVALSSQLELKEVEGKLERAVAAGEMQLLGTPVQGMWACALFPQDNKYYRARITGVSETEVDVLFLDYGNFTTVSLDQIYHLPPQLLTTNIQALRCRLYDVCPSGGVTWSEESCNFFEELVNIGTTIVLISKGAGQSPHLPLPVQLKIGIGSKAKDASQVLMDNSFATPFTTLFTAPLTAPLTMPVTVVVPHSPPAMASATPTSATPTSASDISPSLPSSPAVATPPGTPTTTPPGTPTTTPPGTPTTTPPGTPTTTSPDTPVWPPPAVTTVDISSSPTSPLPPSSTLSPSSPVSVATPLSSPLAAAPSAGGAATPPSPPPALVFPMATLPDIGKAFTCEVVHVSSTQLFHVARQDLAAVVAALGGLGGVAGESRPWQVGQAALAFYEGTWHRVQYQGIATSGQEVVAMGDTTVQEGVAMGDTTVQEGVAMGDTTVQEGVTKAPLHKVLYVDYGNSDVATSLAPIPEHLCQWPPQAIPCSLAQGQLTGSAMTAEEFCIKVANQVLEVKVQEVTSKRVLVVMLTTNGVSIA